MTTLALTSACLTLVTFCYASLCAGSPFGNCRKCRGLGFALKTTRHGKPKRGKTCRRCKGHGKRIRVGRHLFNLAARIHRDGTATAPRRSTRP